jgi:exosome complex component RRP40
MKNRGTRGGHNKNELREVVSEPQEQKENTSSKLQQKQKYLHHQKYVKPSSNENIKKILLFPGEEYDFNEKLIHYDAFGFSNGNLVSKRCGVILCDENGKALEDTNEEVYKSLGKYYSPKVDDFVLGTIVQKSSEYYKIDINSYTTAILNTKDFEGATKKQKPNLNLGDLIFARVLKVNKYDSPILSCVSLHEHKNWASGESYFGNLKGGNVFTFNKTDTWEFYKENYALNRLNDAVGYEIIIGFNGRMWINSDTPENIFNIYEILMKSLTVSKEEVEKMIHKTFLDQVKK